MKEYDVILKYKIHSYLPTGQDPEEYLFTIKFEVIGLSENQEIVLGEGQATQVRVDQAIHDHASLYEIFDTHQDLTDVSRGTPYNTDWAVNSSAPNTIAGETESAAQVLYYADPDGVVRPADGIFGSQSSGDGEPLFTSAGTGSGASGDTTTATSSGNITGNTQHGRRPVILNRPFRNVGELGYVFRDLPFKTLDFFSSSSADAALLDFFSVTDEPTVLAGQFNPNNSPYPVIQAMLSYGSKKDLDSTYNMTSSNAKLVAQKITLSLTASGPILNRAGLVTQFQQYSIANSGLTAVADKGNKAYFEAPVRALADVTNTRTWNLLIDIIAQSGQMSPTAVSLTDFIVQGERRYWLHIAIDRYTGKILDQQLEPVYE